MDIVERLRKKADTLEPYPSDHKDDFREAADEIERLRAALEDSQQRLQFMSDQVDAKCAILEEKSLKQDAALVAERETGRSD